MPPIKVKGNAYSSLDDSNIPEDYDIPPNTQPSISQQTPSPLLLRITPNISTRLSLPFLRGEPPDVRLSAIASTTPNRPRAATTASRIHAHCTSSAGIRSSQFWGAEQDVDSLQPGVPSPSPSRSPNVAYPQAGQLVTLEGMQTDLRISSRGEPGLIEHSINLSHTEEEDDVDHHHDDVVDHLDVIGTNYVSLFVKETRSNVVHEDSQIGVFANLTNAANSIVMYVWTHWSSMCIK